MNHRVGETVGDYEIIGVLGAGGMGEAYQVRHVLTERVEHPNIIQLRTAFWAENQFALIMEYVDGATLAERLRENRG